MRLIPRRVLPWLYLRMVSIFVRGMKARRTPNPEAVFDTEFDGDCMATEEAQLQSHVATCGQHDALVKAHTSTTPSAHQSYKEMKGLAEDVVFRPAGAASAPSRVLNAESGMRSECLSVSSSHEPRMSGSGTAGAPVQMTSRPIAT